MKPEELEQLMNQHQITQADLSRRMRVTEGAISRWRGGTRVISPSQARKLTESILDGTIKATPEQIHKIRDAARVMRRVVQVNFKQCPQWEELWRQIQPLWGM